MITRVINALTQFRTLSRMNIAFSKAAVAAPLRQLDDSNPLTWEFSGFSQNNEDGIIDYLCSKLLTRNRYFVEIGSADGLENNTAWLALAKKYSGLMVEGNSNLAKSIKKNVCAYNLGVELSNIFITKENLSEFLSLCQHHNPDVFSIDIDGNDYHILSSLLERGFLPKIIVVEYNSAFGPSQALTIPYIPLFNYAKAHPSGIYYGVSLQAYQRLLHKYHYQFVSVESNGVNAFFIHKNDFSKEFVEKLRGLDFAENFYQKKKLKVDWAEQFKMIEHCDLVEV